MADLITSQAFSGIKSTETQRQKKEARLQGEQDPILHEVLADVATLCGRNCAAFRYSTRSRLSGSCQFLAVYSRWLEDLELFLSITSLAIVAYLRIHILSCHRRTLDIVVHLIQPTY